MLVRIVIILLLLLLLLLSYAVAARDGSGHPVCTQVSARRTLPGASGPVRSAGHRSSGDQRRHTAGSFRTGPMRQPGTDLRAVKGAHSRPDDGAGGKEITSRLQRGRRRRRSYTLHIVIS